MYSRALIAGTLALVASAIAASAQVATTIATVDGTIFDTDGQRVLYAPTGTSNVLAIYNIGSGNTITLTGGASDDAYYGFLSPVGAVFVDKAASNFPLYLYNGTLSQLAQIDSGTSLSVAGNYAVYSTGSTLSRLDLTTGAVETVPLGALNNGNSVTASGLVAFTNSYNIYAFDGTATTAITNTNNSVAWNFYPLTDGHLFLFDREAPCCSTTYSELVLSDGTTEEILRNSTNFVTRASPVYDYQIDNNWVVFRDDNGNIVRRAPDGTLTTYGVSYRILDLAPNGDVAYFYNNHVYLLEETGSLLDMGTGYASVVGPNPGGAVFAGGHWYFFGSGKVDELGTSVVDIDAAFASASGTFVAAGGTTLLGVSDITTPRSIELDGQVILDTQGYTVVQAGSITGSGSLNKTGTGTLILTADANHSGGTTVSQGTLQIGNGGTTGSLTGDVAVGGTLVFDRGNAFTFAGPISGDGAIIQAGNGTTTLSGTSSFSGTLAVDSGTLDINGSMAAAAVTVSGGATIKGTGAVGRLTLESGSVVAPGNSIGTLHVTSNVSFDDGSVYMVETNASGGSDQIVASGTASIAGGAAVQIAAGNGSYPGRSIYRILTSNGALTGSFGGITIDRSDLTPTLVYGSNSVDLVLLLNTLDFSPYAHSANQVATAAAIKSGGFGSDIYDSILQQYPNTSFIAGALDQMSGDIHASLRSAMLNDARTVRETILDRLQDDGGVDGRRLSEDTTLWVHDFASWGSIDSDGNAGSIGQAQSGILVGIDSVIADGLLIGIQGGYWHASASSNFSADNAKSDDGVAGAYAAWARDVWTVRGGAAFAWGATNVRRRVSYPNFNQVLASHQNQQSDQFFAEVGYRMKTTGDVVFEPVFGLTHTDTSTGAFAESGGTAALADKTHTLSQTFSSLGFHVKVQNQEPDLLNLGANLSLAWEHSFGALAPKDSPAFIATAQHFSVSGVPLDRDALSIRANLSIEPLSGATLSVGYEGLWSDRVTDNTARLTFSLAL